MEAGLPEENSAQSEEGRILHEHMEKPEISRATLTRSQSDLLDTAARLQKEIYRRVYEQFNCEDIPGAGGREITMWLHRGIKSLFPGHCDLRDYFSEIKLLLIIDWKFGYRAVEPAEANVQLRSYAVMGSELHDCEHVVVAIGQPRLSRDEQLTMAVYTRRDIALARQQLYEIWDAAKAPDAPLNATEEGCRYCKARLLCDAYKAKFLAISDGIDRSTLATAERSLAECTDDQLDRILVACQFADFIKDQARDEARARVAAGGLPGWKLGKESELREITDPQMARAAMVGAGGMAEGDFMNCCAPSIKKLEEKVREKDGGTWKESKDKVESLLSGLIERKPKKAPLVRLK